MKISVITFVALFPLFLTAFQTEAATGAGAPAIWIGSSPEKSLVFAAERNSVLVFRANRQATFLKKNRGMKHPNGIAVLENGPFSVKDLLFVTDSDANRILIYSIPDFQPKGILAEGIPQPMEIALYQSKTDPVLYAYVVYKHAVANKKVVRFRIIEENGKFSAIKEIQFGEELGAEPESVIVDAERKRVFVPDESKRNIKVYDLDGRWESNFGNGEFQSRVKGIGIANCEQDYIIASDQQRSRTEFEFFDRATYKHLATIRGKTSTTDGIAVTTSPLAGFPEGLIVAQNDSLGRTAEFYDLKQMLAEAGLPSCVSSNTMRIPKPRLLLVLAIDQLQYQYLPRFQNLFSGGFKKDLKWR